MTHTEVRHISSCTSSREVLYALPQNQEMLLPQRNDNKPVLFVFLILNVNDEYQEMLLALPQNHLKLCNCCDRNDHAGQLDLPATLGGVPRTCAR